MILDRKKSFGTIYPPMGKAFFEQGGKLFDQQGNLLSDDPQEPAEPVQVTAPVVINQPQATQPSSEQDDEALVLQNIQKILDNHETLHFQKIKQLAKPILGQSLPSTKQGILDALKAIMNGEDVKITDSDNDNFVVDGIDLRAWGMGQADYIWTDVQKAIRSKFSIRSSNKYDAVTSLIEQKVISETEARADVDRKDQ